MDHGQTNLSSKTAQTASSFRKTSNVLKFGPAREVFFATGFTTLQVFQAGSSSLLSTTTGDNSKLNLDKFSPSANKYLSKSKFIACRPLYHSEDGSMAFPVI